MTSVTLVNDDVSKPLNEKTHLIVSELVQSNHKVQSVQRLHLTCREVRRDRGEIYE